LIDLLRQLCYNLIVHKKVGGLLCTESEKAILKGEGLVRIEYSDVRITVLKRLALDDIIKEYATDEAHSLCSKYPEGTEYISQNCNKPNGFCSWAWAEMQSKVVFLALGNNYPWIKQNGTEIFCCSDGLHPVVYKLERV